MNGVGMLTRRVYATGLHGVTGAPVDEGWLEAGTLVRGVEIGESEDGLLTQYKASTDGGRTWYAQETCGAIDVEEVECR